MIKLLVFTSDSRESKEHVEQLLGIPHKHCKFLMPGARGIQGFKDIKYIAHRKLDDYEAQYAVQHNITPAMPDELQALQMELTGSLPEDDAKVDEAAAAIKVLRDLGKKISLRAFSDDELIIELERRDRVNKYHTAQVTMGDFTMKHTLRCHPDLFNCDIHAGLLKAFNDHGGLAPMPEGLYRLWWEGEGDDRKLQMGQLTPPGVDAPAVLDKTA